MQNFDARLEGIRIGFLLSSLGLGGAERQAFLLGRYLHEREGAQVRFFTVGPRGQYADACEDLGIPWEHFVLNHRQGGYGKKFTDVGRFALVLRRRRIQAVMPYCMFQNILAALAWRLGGAQACIWNQRDEGRSRLQRWVERVAVRQVPLFVANSAHGAEFLTTELRVSRRNVHLVPNGVELPEPEKPRAEWRRGLSLPENAFCAAMVANLHGFKDHQTLAAAWRIVIDRLEHDREMHLLLAGVWGDQYETVAQMVGDLRLTERVHFLGQVEDVAGLLDASDLCVFSSSAEGVPNAVLESMAAGLAVVATDYPGIREALGPDAAILLAPPRDPAALAERIICAASSASLRAVLGESGRRRVSDHFSLPAMNARMATLIARALR